MKLPLWRLTTLRRKIFERLRSSRFSKPAYADIHSKLLQYFDKPGYFIEAGAVDGFFESNTYYLEKYCGWQGILIEPVPEMFNRLATNRPTTIAFNTALVSCSQNTPTVKIECSHALSKVVNVSEEINRTVIHVPAKTLTEILCDVNPKKIDLLSLDVEGFELDVLKGLDFTKYQPQYMLIECLNIEKKAAIDSFLLEKYKCIDSFTDRDFLYIIDEHKNFI